MGVSVVDSKTGGGICGTVAILSDAVRITVSDG